MVKSSRDSQLSQLRQKHPDWYVWYVSKAYGRTVWLAGKPSNMLATFEAQSAEELDSDLAGTNGDGR